MARIPEEEIERLKREIPVEMLVAGLGVELKRTGANLVGRCPFHEDHTPSLVVTPETNLWHCLGACQTGGFTIDWVMRTQDVSLRHAVELLRAESGHEHFNGSVVFPIFSLEGDVLGMYGRKIAPILREATPLHT
jgi:DNA primase